MLSGSWLKPQAKRLYEQFAQALHALQKLGAMRMEVYVFPYLPPYAALLPRFRLVGFGLDFGGKSDVDTFLFAALRVTKELSCKIRFHCSKVAKSWFEDSPVNSTIYGKGLRRLPKQ